MSNEALSRRTAVAYKVQADYDTTDVSGSGFAVVESAVPTLSTGLAVFARDSVRSAHATLAPVVGSTHGGTLTLSFPLMGVSATTPVANPTANFLSVCLAQIMGGQLASGYAASAVSGGTAGSLTIDTGVASTTYKSGAGVIVGIAGGVNGLGIVQEVTDGGVGDHTVALRHDLADTPTAGGARTFGTLTSYIADTAPVAITLSVQTSNVAGQVLLGGCVCTSLKIPLGSRQDMRVEATFMVNDIRQDVSGAAIAATSYTLPLLKPPTNLYGGRMLIDATETSLQSAELTLTQTLLPVESHNARTGVVDVVATDRKATLAYRQILTGAASGLASLPTVGKIFIQAGTATGAMFGFAMPAPIVVAAKSLEDSEGVWGQSTTVQQGFYTGDVGGDATTDAPCAIYQG